MFKCLKIAGVGGDLCPRSYDPGQREPENHDPNVESEGAIKGVDQGCFEPETSWTRSIKIVSVRSTWTRVDQIDQGLCDPEVNLDHSGSDQTHC
jgi:hypothetical protein